LCQEKGKEIDLESFTVQALADLAWNFGLVHLAEEQFLDWQGAGSKDSFVNPVVEEWKALSDTLGQKVVYGYDVVRKPLYRAVVKNIDVFGGLVLQLENGAIVTENSGEIIYEDLF
jgi:BirA family biotin operon repressor/biotin-[acetyl-CoA-carboxylase] ligase